MANILNKPEPPALPLATEDYSRFYTDQKDNVLRLFFNRLSNTIASLLSTSQGGRFLYNPCGLFYSTQNQTAAAVNTGYAVTFNNTYIGEGISVESNSRITVTSDGIYNFQLTMQLDHTNSSDATLYAWINKSGTDVGYSGLVHNVKGNDYHVAHWNFSIDLEAGDYIEMYWATSDTGLTLATVAATTPHPGVSSAVLSVSFVSNY